MTTDALTYEDLEHRLRNWSSMKGQGYDFIGMVHLFRACLLNLAENATPEDWAEVIDLFEEKDRQLVMRLASAFAAAGPLSVRRL